MSDKSKTRLAHLAPILASLLFGTLCASLIKSSSMEPFPVAPFSEETFGFFGSFGNAFYFVILVGIGATLLYLLLKRRSNRLIMMLTGFALTTAVFMLSIVYMSAALAGFDIPYADAIVVIPALTITALAIYAVFRNNYRLANVTVLGIGGALGAFLGFSIPTESTVLILGFLAVYDAFAVYRGPVGKIAHRGLDQLRGLSFSFKDIQMGLGDLTFYSMLSGHMLLSYGLFSWLASVVGILAGCILSFKMLEKKGVFPGLPFPIAFGLAAGFLASLL
jgi:presenilin-like A22 family membrane protease